MASLHPAPNMAPGNVSLPPNLTQQNVQEILQVSFFSLSTNTSGNTVTASKLPHTLPYLDFIVGSNLLVEI